MSDKNQINRETRETHQRPVAFEQTFPCSACGRPVQIRVPAPGKATGILCFWIRVLGGKCKACLAKEMSN